MNTQNRKPLFLGSILVAILAIVIAIYYLIPGFTHIFASGTSIHIKHAIGFFALACVAIGIASVNRPKKAEGVGMPPAQA